MGCAASVELGVGLVDLGASSVELGVGSVDLGAASEAVASEDSAGSPWRFTAKGLN